MIDQPTPLTCANHPNTETLLRCNRCEKPICIKCAIQTPTGYRCKECVRGQQKVFETAQLQDIPLAFTAATVLSFLGSLIAGAMGFFVIFIAPIVGTIIAEAAPLSPAADGQKDSSNSLQREPFWEESQ